MKRTKVLSLAHLAQLAEKRRSVVLNTGWAADPTPAAWAIQWSAARVHQLLRAGMFVYEPFEGSKSSLWSGKRSRWRAPVEGTQEYQDALRWAKRQKEATA